MSQKIFKLSSETIDKIAAGEVVENPSSVVKELVENALDAGASSIRVEILGGGLQKIRILDDGEGMSEVDALLSIERHATSKLTRAEDLSMIETMGFRGEALSSISAVSKFSLLTKHKESKEEAAIHIFVHEGIKIKKGARTIGTTIEVSELFYNTPARKKFQKSALASLREVTKLMTRLALSHPSVGFTFFAGGKEVFSTQKGSWQERIASLLPNSYLEKGCFVEEKKGKFHLYGVVGLPSEAQSHRSSQYLFINKRAVQSPFLSSVVSEAFATRLSAREHPPFVLYLEVDPSEIDINVHPQKKEVKFSREEEIGSLFKRGVTKALVGQERAHFSREAEPTPPAVHALSSMPLVYQEMLQKVEGISEEVSLFGKEEREIKMLSSYRHLVFVASQDFNEVFAEHKVAPGFLVIDLKEVAKRLIYDATYQRLEGQQNSGAIQSLFFPVTIEVTYEEALLLEENLPLMEKLGLSIRLFGKCHFVIDGLNPLFKEEDIGQIVKGGIEVLQAKAKEEHKRREMALLATRFATFSTTHFSRMMKELMRSSMPYFSPTGLPTIAHVKEESFSLFFKEFNVEKSH